MNVLMRHHESTITCLEVGSLLSKKKERRMEENSWGELLPGFWFYGSFSLGSLSVHKEACTVASRAGGSQSERQWHFLSFKQWTIHLC